MNTGLLAAYAPVHLNVPFGQPGTVRTLWKGATLALVRDFAALKGRPLRLTYGTEERFGYS